MDWTLGSHWAVRYRADPRIYHAREVLAVVRADRVVTLTPDGDMYPMDLSTPPLMEVLPMILHKAPLAIVRFIRDGSIRSRQIALPRKSGRRWRPLLFSHLCRDDGEASSHPLAFLRAPDRRPWQSCP